MTEDERIAALQSEDGLEVAPGVRVRLRSLADYRQNDENPVSHTPRNLGAVIESIHKVGAARSGLSSKGKILAGNLTSEAMAEAGIEGIIEVTTDGTQWVMVNREDLTPEQEKQAAHADQRSAMLAEIDIDQLLIDLEGGIDLSSLWYEDEIAEMIDHAQKTSLSDPKEAKRDLGDRERQIRAVMYAKQVSTFERAIRATGIKNRGEALIVICKAFLNEEGPYDAAFESLLEEIASD